MYCSHCGTQFEGKFCPNCGAPAPDISNQFESKAQTVKEDPLNNHKKKKGRGCITNILLFILISGVIGSCSSMLGGNEKKTETSANSTAKVSEEETTAESERKELIEETALAPRDELENDFEKAVLEETKKVNGEMISINTEKMEETEVSTVVAGVLIENNEDIVNQYLNQIAELVKKDDSIDSIIITFGDKKKGKDGPVLLMALVNSDGSITTSLESIDYNTARNQWIKGQFSQWDGSHTDLKKLVIKNLNDEKSFKHINTTYIDIKDDETKEEINKILDNAGYKNRVEIGDLWITMEFSAKNAFNATIKNTAYGIASYNDNRITLINIE